MELAKRTVLIIVAALSLALGYRFLDDLSRQGGIGNYLEARESASELKKALEFINAYHVDGDASEIGVLTESAMEGMISQLDPYSEYLDFERLKRLDEETSQEFGGIGVQVEMRDEYVTVVAPLEGTPGERAGLLRGDRIVEVDGESLKGLGFMESVAKLKGRPGTKVAISVVREAETDRLKLEIIRELIEVDNVHGAEILNEGIGYLRISQFGRRTGEELSESVDLLLERGMQALIIDLRNNPGGLLDSAVEVASQFLPHGELIVSTKGRHDSMSEEWRAVNRGQYHEFPLAVLINPGSASASEIVAGALKDSGRAKLVGDKTFGKGSVQSILPLGSASGLKLTTAKYYTPGGYVIHKRGVEPDIVVEISPHEEANLTIQRSRLKTMPTEEFVEQFEFEPTEDKQLIKAVDLLKAIVAQS
ncbi:MAG: S41 family peptidase [Verrucomicrobiota bacterium]|nr:S41 family peptidase [Verrucomicrobiota bacterium]